MVEDFECEFSCSCRILVESCGLMRLLFVSIVGLLGWLCDWCC